MKKGVFKFYRHYLMSLTVILFVFSNLNAQVFSGFNSFKKMIEFEGQRFLMSDIYTITNDGVDRLKIEKTISEIDQDEGFMFVLTSYKFDDKSGVVITAFNAVNFQNTKHQFVNVHLTHDEFIKLDQELNELKEFKLEKDEHIIKSFNERLVLDYNGGNDSYYYFTIWIDLYSRHTFDTNKWYRAVKSYLKFIE